ncbi:MAG TPA: hypothetical protein EYI81_03615 [Gammaproteobacteria bacterium]|nr:hypothetical protein [Gammaproteobacteria bacterium]
MKKNFNTYLVALILMSLFLGCTSSPKKETNFYDLEVEKFSSSVKLLLTDLEFLKKEILKVNANKPSVQRILIEADDKWMKEDLKKASSALERGLRIAKDESALYLRLAHVRLEQGLIKESSAFAERGLLNKNASSWELLLLKIYSAQK